MKPLAVLALAMALCAADMPVSGPVLGFVLDPSLHRVRPILGIAGASTTGQPLDAGADLNQAVFSPVHNFILALAGDASTPLLIVPNQPGVPIAGAQAGASRIVLSPEGAAAALYFQQGARAQILTGLPDAPSIARSVDLSALPSPPTALALSDDAAALVAIVGGNAPALYVFTADGAMSLITLAEPATAFAFLNRSHDAVLTGASAAFLLHDVTGAATLAPLVSDGVSSPAAVVVAGDNTQAIALNSNFSGIVTLDLTGGPSGLNDCACAATGLARLAGNATFRLTDYTGDPLLLFDASPGNARVLFVPPAAAAQEN
ncbi:MAG TPA: hypothetical protein VKV15_07290 [Bryobacteraceae bacterium]|nr:hypothetical protein [Bryobacteraceae bacterium]